MGQKQFITYQSDILSFEAREAMLGVLNSGRYSGYNVLATNGSPAAGSIPLKLQHTGGVQKLAKGGSSLDSAIGVIVTTQGVIIHEDQEVTITITDNNAGGSIKYSLVYMEHEYLDGVPGPNPAIYGVINGTAGGGVPALTSSYKRSIVGVVEQAIGGLTIADCTWHPRPSDNIFGDSKILQKLFGSDADFNDIIMGNIPSDGVIGTRLYTENNYVTDEESITDSIDNLDIELKAIDTLLTAVEARAIDSSDWGLLTDNTNQNVSTARHGLMPKLPNDANQYLNGVGTWTALNALLAANNLSDLVDPAVARTNLGVITSAEIASYYFWDSGWQDMTSGVAANAADFSIKIRRMGRLVVVSGQFTGGSNMSANAIIAQIQYSLINPTGVQLMPSTKIYFAAPASIDDRLLRGYVPAGLVSDSYLYLKMHVTQGDTPDNDYCINFSFYVD